MNKDTILKAFQFRHACKEFDSTKKIKDDDFEFILETARLSPSSFGFEPWHFIVVQDPSLREQLKDAAWGAKLKLDTASHFILGLTIKKSYMRYDSPYLQSFMKEVQKLPNDVIDAKSGFFKDFQLSDFNLIEEREVYDWASKQCYIALGNMMTSAALIGIDSCPIEGFNIEKTEQLLAKEFGVDMDKYGLSYMLALGYRKVDQPIKTRRELEEIVTWF